MSQQERGRGRGVGGHGQMRGRGVYHSPSPRPLRPEYQNFEGHPGSGYHPPQYSSGGMHSDHPGSRYPPPQYSPSPIHSGHPESSYHPPQYSAHPYQNIPTSTFPPHYQQQSVISVAVIQSTPQPAPVPQQAPPDQYYSDRHPMQSPASYFQPNQSDHLPPKHGDYIGQNIGHEPYSRDNIFLPSQQYQKPFPARDHGAYSEDHFHETGGSHFRPPRSSSAGFSQPFKTKQEHDHRGSQEKYVSGQQAYDHPTGQKKQYGPPKQGHIRASKQKFPGSQQGHDTSQVKIGTQQKQDLHTGQKHQGSQQKSDNYETKICSFTRASTFI
uniref:Uncharacterized protein n=1 Tax=Arion vulgaris TaxID=1028688 RepID=A0A0B7APB1_9EUPU